MNKISLLDYANGRNKVVVFATTIGDPMGDYFPSGHPDLDVGEQYGLYDIEGEVDDGGDWHWDGEGSPRDDQGNSFTKIQAYSDPKAWGRIVDEWESGE
jgi:hypothetical protein